ncbi:proton-conducting transporter transmembrane domain-containing protein [Halorussus salinus]|uniref:proton-conducting transporter transmembrane domain-containing protein n=1 Tax=Halorussus salinus TaxID=1364935 RepID=UPI0010923FBF|nr:proton-conducting transporter membrane subunit [Halorussus salinus]
MSLLVALVGVPVVGAALAVLLDLLAGRNGRVDAPDFDSSRLARRTALATLAVHAALAVALVARVADEGRVRTVVADLPPRVGIALAADPFAALVVAVVAVVSTGAVWYALAVGVGDARSDALFVLLAGGLSGIAVTADLFNLYVFLEIAGLAAYALVSVGEEGSARAAFRYLLVGTVGATLYLLAVGYLYIGTGNLNIAESNKYISQIGLDAPLVLAAFALAFVGLAVKIPLVPVHTWLPDAHAKASVPASVDLSALVTTAGTYAFVTVLYGAFGVGFLDANPAVGSLVSGVGAVSLLVGGVGALREETVKRVLAYSTVSQLGIVVVGVGLGTSTGLTGAAVHLLGHAVTKAGLFFAAGLLALSTGAKTVEEYAGVGYRAPVASAAFAVLAFGMVGVPPTVGFAGKWYVLVAAARAEAWLLVAAVLASSLLSVAYFGRILVRMYFAEDGGADDVAPRTPGDGSDGSSGLSALPALAALATVALGLGAATLAQFLEPAIRGLLA